MPEFRRQGAGMVRANGASEGSRVATWQAQYVTKENADEES
jgi:hypothetical protein